MKLIARLVLAVVSWTVEHLAHAPVTWSVVLQGDVAIVQSYLHVFDNPLHVASLMGGAVGALWAHLTRGGGQPGLVLAVVSWAGEHILHGHWDVLDSPLHIVTLILVVVSAWARRKRGVSEQRKLD